MLSIPTAFDSTPFYTLQVNLDGAVFLLKFRFNQRENVWRLSIYDTENTPLLLGVKIVVGRNLLKRSVDPRMPQGALFADNQTSDASPPGLNDLGETQRVRLLYVTQAELAILGPLS